MNYDYQEHTRECPAPVLVTDSRPQKVRKLHEGQSASLSGGCHHDRLIPLYPHSNLPDGLHKQNQSSGQPDNSNVSDGDGSSIQDTRRRRLPVGSRLSAMPDPEFSTGESALNFGSLLDCAFSEEYLQCNDCGLFYTNAPAHYQSCRGNVSLPFASIGIPGSRRVSPGRNVTNAVRVFNHQDINTALLTPPLIRRLQNWLTKCFPWSNVPPYHFQYRNRHHSPTLCPVRRASLYTLP
jgi:hypothetical protein